MGLITQPKPVAIYVRVSPKPEGAAGDNFSVDSQLFELRKLAKEKYGNSDPDVYIDRNRSGASLDRPELDRLRGDIAAKRYKGGVIIAYSPDRWTRGGEMDAVILDMELQKGGAKLDFCSGSYEDSPEGQLSRDVQNSVSKYERAKFRERAARCRRQKSRDGHPHACHAPDGYKYEGHKFGKKGAYVIVPERAKVVRLIFQQTARGMTNASLAAYLNERKIPTQKGHPWMRTSVAQIVEKTAYYGVMIQNGQEIKVPEIVPRELWNRAHDALRQNKVARVGRPSREYLLTGMIWCARCGKRCTTTPNSGYPCYRCNYRDRYNPNIRLCDAPMIAQSNLEPAVWNAVWNAVCDPGLLWQLIEAYYDRVAGAPAKKNPVAARIDRARRSVARAQEILSDPDQPIPYAEAKANLEAARRELAEAQIAGGAAVAVMPLRKDVEQARREFCAMRDEIQSFAGRRKALQLLVEKVRYADGEAEIHCHLPAPTAENCNRRISDDCNSLGAYPFVINCAVPPGVPPDKRTPAAFKGWQTRRKRAA